MASLNPFPLKYALLDISHQSHFFPTFGLKLPNIGMYGIWYGRSNQTLPRIFLPLPPLQLTLAHMLQYFHDINIMQFLSPALTD